MDTAGLTNDSDMMTNDSDMILNGDECYICYIADGGARLAMLRAVAAGIVLPP
jgi:hypothetical protein